MEWAMLLLFAVLAVVLVALPGASPLDGFGRVPDASALWEQQRLLLAELRDLDEDAEAGRISVSDRREGRRALAPRLRAAAEALREVEERPEAVAAAGAGESASEQA